MFVIERLIVKDVTNDEFNRFSSEEEEKARRNFSWDDSVNRKPYPLIGDRQLSGIHCPQRKETIYMPARELCRSVFSTFDGLGRVTRSSLPFLSFGSKLEVLCCPLYPARLFILLETNSPHRQQTHSFSVCLGS
jgi:hypothetical protein